MKYCNGCSQTLTSTLFRIIKRNGKRFLASRCIDCEPKYQRDYRKRNKERIRHRQKFFYYFDDEMRLKAFANRQNIDFDALEEYIRSKTKKYCEICLTD